VLFENNKWLCYGNSDTIDWSYIIAEDERFEYIDAEKLGCESLVEISLSLSLSLSLVSDSAPPNMAIAFMGLWIIIIIIIIITTTIFIVVSCHLRLQPYARVHCGSSGPKSVSARWSPTRRPRCKLNL